MKKTFKKLMAALLAVALLCAMAVPAMAAGTTYTITIENPVGSYEAYQIFSGSLNEDGQLGNIQWGSGVSAAGQTHFGNAAGKAGTLENSQSVAEAFAADLKDYLGTVSGTYSNGTISGLEAGYYLIKNSSVGDNQTYTSFILCVVKNTTIHPKGDKPSLDKKVQDTNDTTGQSTGWQDSADYDIGDKVPFQLTANIASNFADYSTYKFVFHDKQSDGLSFDSTSVNVTVGGVQLSNNQYTVTTATNDGCTFHVEISDLKKIPSAVANAQVIVTYKSTLNSNAVIGSAGNPNKAHLEYSNNPYDSNSTTNTPDDKVTVFTFKIVANKVNGNNKSLPGAAFALYKKNSDNTWNLVSLSNATCDDTNHTYTLVNNTVTQFTWNGLDAGTYKLVEIITPAGYNTIADQEFTISATHDVSSDDSQFGELTVTPVGSDISFTVNKADGSLTTNVVNNAGATLPSTGGMGTTLFYVIGGGLMVAAVVLLVTKKRMENK